MINFLTSVAFRIWQLVVSFFSRVSWVVVLGLSVAMGWSDRTRRPNVFMLCFWIAVDALAYLYLTHHFTGQQAASIGAALAAAHLLVMIASLIVMGEENDIWNGFIRVDDRSFSRGGVVKSLPLILSAVLFYVLYMGWALKGFHSSYAIFSVNYNEAVPAWLYAPTILSKIPVLEQLIEHFAPQTVMTFQGDKGECIKLGIIAINTFFIVAMFANWYQQKTKIRELIDVLGSDSANMKGDEKLLMRLAACAPEEIKSSIIDLAVNDPEGDVRWRAMQIAKYAAILTFPQTAIYNLHREKVLKNKMQALNVSIDIVKNNLAKINADMREVLRGKIKHQREVRRKKHDEAALQKLEQLNGLL